MEELKNIWQHVVRRKKNQETGDNAGDASDAEAAYGKAEESAFDDDGKDGKRKRKDAKEEFEKDKVLSSC